MKTIKKSMYTVSFFLFFLYVFTGAAVQAQTDVLCDLKVFPGRACVGQPVIIDLRGSRNVSAFRVNVFDSQGLSLDHKIMRYENAVWQRTFSSPGIYTVKAQAANKMGEYTSIVCEEQVYVDSLPECRLWTDCMPCYECVGRPIVFYSEAVHPEVRVAQARFDLRNEVGAVLESIIDEEAPFTWTAVLKSPGNYRVTSTITDGFGSVSRPCFVDIEIREKRLYGLLEIGPLFARASEGIFAAIRVGILYEILPPVLDFILSVGGGIALEGDPSKSFFIANALLNLNLARFFFGGGIGYSTEVVDGGGTDFELVGNAGFYIFKHPCQNRGALFFELRAPLGSGRPFSDYNKLMLGFRFLF